MTAGILSTDEGVASSAGGTSSLRIAVLDRDSGFIQVLGKRMDRLGWEHRVLASPVPTDAIASMRLSALVVDLAVLGPPAWEWLERLCGALPELGIVVCTGPSTVAQRVRGLRLGADDWITKPCHPEEVIARVQGLVRRRRRATARTESKPVSAGEVQIRSDRFQAFVGGRSLELTRREFELIELLASGEGRVLEREEIYSRLWGYAMVRGDRSVDVFVRKLRQKLEKASPEWRYIHTHFGIGYRFAAEMAGETKPEGERPDDTQTGPDLGADSNVGDELDSGIGPDLGSNPGRGARSDLSDGDVRNQGKLGGTQQEYELSASGA
jgi:DNA-binding response OmpR family regulator